MPLNCSKTFKYFPGILSENYQKPAANSVFKGNFTTETS